MERVRVKRVKVDDSAEANILPLDSFSTMFPHALDIYGYPKDRFLRRLRTNLECYNDQKVSIMAASHWNFSIIQMSHFKTILFML